MLKQKLRAMVIDVGEPWLGAEGVERDYLSIVGSSPYPPLVSADLETIRSLPADSYLVIATTWDGRGPTPVGIWSAWRPQRIVLVSSAYIEQEVRENE